MARSIDFNPRATIAARQQEFLQLQESGRSAQEAYQQLYPDYQTAYDQAVAFQDTVQAAYDAFQANKTQANLDSYNDLSAQYSQLQTNYRQYEPQLQELQATMAGASTRLQEIEGELPELQRSLQIDREAPKRQARERSGTSILTRGTRRAGSVR
jgi:chromosome segregation ATPase